MYFNKQTQIMHIDSKDTNNNSSCTWNELQIANLFV